MKKLKPWQVVLLIIFYPIGLFYLIAVIVSKIMESHKRELAAREYAEQQAKINAIILESKKKNEEAAANRKIYLEKQREKFAQTLASIPRINITPDKSAKKQNMNVADFYLEPSILRKNINLSRVSNFVVIDTETTGLIPGQHKIVQVSAILFENCQPSAIFNTYLNPGCHIPEEATAIHGITDQTVSDAPTFESILPALEEFIGVSTLVGHNLQFDLKFLRKFGYDSMKEKRLYFDTLTLSRKYDDIDRHKLSDACEAHGIHFNAHDSSEDALATGLLFIDYLKEKVDGIE